MLKNKIDSQLEKSFNNILSKKKNEKQNIIGLLQQAQDIFGYLTEKTMQRIAYFSKKSPSEIYGVATFYSQFRFKPMGKYMIRLCHGTACHVARAESLDLALETELGITAGETTKDMLFSIERVACLGCCSLAPVVMIDKEVYGKLTGNKLVKIVRKIKRT